MDDAAFQPPARNYSWRWLPVWVGLLAWQLWLSLTLFGSDPIGTLFNDEMVFSGSHPQHQYLGQQADWVKGRTSAFVEAFQIGFLKTPIFDGSRVAEAFYFLAGGTNRPAAYKLGIVCVCLLVPVLLLVACRGAGLSNLATLLATSCGQLVWWGPLGRGALEAGDSELLLAALAGLAHMGCLLAFHRNAGALAWIGMLLTGCLGWFLQPLLFPIALPLLLSFYLSVGVKHEFSTWHIAFWSAEQFAVLVNLPWLVDWVSYWWLRTVLPTPTTMLEHRTFASIWNAPLWGGPADRAFTVFLMASAVVGTILLNHRQQRPAARLLALGAGGALTLSLLGVSWEPLGVVGTGALLAPALWFAALPAAHAWTWFGGALWRQGLTGRIGLALVAGLAGIGALSVTDAACFIDRCSGEQPLAIGLSAERATLVEQLKQHTTTEARIVWEDRTLPRKASRWAALLPVLTGRSFIGGLDPDGFIEHSSISLMAGSLEGRPLSTWSDEQLEDYCGRCNVGWVIAWTPSVRERFEAWSGAESVLTVRDGGEGQLFRVKREPRFALKGSAELKHADSQSIVLANVVPDRGVVVLSLHYQAGMRVSPGRIQIEREPSGDDPIGFLRLRLAETATWVELTWRR